MQSEVREACHWCPTLTSPALLSKNSWFPPKRRKTTIHLRKCSNTTWMGLPSITQTNIFLVHVSYCVECFRSCFLNRWLLQFLVYISINTMKVREVENPLNKGFTLALSFKIKKHFENFAQIQSPLGRSHDNWHKAELHLGPCPGYPTSQ